jgi:glycosyltransferase involved in cell wall biosynthesis
MTSTLPSSRPRDGISVVVPFAGSADELTALVARLGRLRRTTADELIVAWNDRDAQARDPNDAGVTVVAATDHGSSYYARNVGVRASRNDWLLFLDDDCFPPDDIVLRWHAHEPASDRVGAVAGAIVSRPGISPVERYAAERRHLDAELAYDGRPSYGATAHLLVRRDCWNAASGFTEAIRSGGDQDFGVALAAGGWTLELDTTIGVEHQHRTSVRSLWRQFRRYGAGNAWLRRRHRDAVTPVRPWRTAASGLRSIFRGVVRRDRDLIRFGALDAVVAAGLARGLRESNAPAWTVAAREDAPRSVPSDVV